MNNRFLLVILAFSMLSVSSITYGQEYRSHQTGNWNNASTWEKYVSGSWSYPSPDYPPLTISSRVTIQSGHTITASGDLMGSTGGIIEIAAGGTLNMGSFLISAPRNIGYRFPVVIIAGTLITNNYVSATSFTISSTGKFITSYPGTRGWWNSGYSPSNPVLAGEVVFNGTEEQTIPDYTFFDLVLTGGDKIPDVNIRVDGSLSIGPGANLLLAGATLFSNGTGIIVNGILDATASSIEFDGGNQSLSGTGTFGETSLIGVGGTSQTHVIITNPNIIQVNELYVSAGSTLTLSPGTKMTVMGVLETGDGLKLQASSSSPYTSASLIVDEAATISGNTETELYLTGGGDEGTYKWHYISSPFASVGVGAFTAVTQDLAQYIETRVTSNQMQGWVASDGYIYMTGSMGGPTFATLDPGKGYNFWDGTNNMITISGALNKSNQTVSLSYTGRPLSGYNLLGNPFTSGLNWDNIANGTYFTYPANTSRAVHFTRDNEMCTYVNGVGTPGDVTGIIPPMQGFFVRTTAGGNSITIPADARTHNNIHQRYKGSADEIPLVRLVLYNNETPKDEAVVRFDEMAKTEFDYDYDAGKMFLSATKTTIHTAIGGTNFAINGLPFPEDGIVTEIPVVINLPAGGTYKIVASQIQGLGLYDLALRDNLAGITTDLRTTPEVIFVSSSGPVSDRFTLLVGDNLMTGIEDPFSGAKAFSIYSGFGFINIMPFSDEWNGSKGTIRLIDLTGKCVTNITDAEFRKNSLVQTEAPLAKGIYIVEINSGKKRFTGKIVIK